MARTRPADRFESLVTCATTVFINAGGFQKTQISDVAEAMGVAKGTVYLYVQSKEALFDLVLRSADRAIAPPEVLPVPTPPAEATLAYVKKRVAEGGRLAPLAKAEKTTAVADGAAELQGILEALYTTLETNRTTIKLVATSAHDMPALAEIWYEAGRRRLNKRLARHLGKRSAQGSLQADLDSMSAARMITETVTWFSVHRHFDLHPDPLDPESARRTAIDGLTKAFAP